MEELEKMSLVELRLYGRKLGMKNATTFKKQELIGEIFKILQSQAQEEKAPEASAVPAAAPIAQAAAPVASAVPAAPVKAPARRSARPMEKRMSPQERRNFQDKRNQTSRPMSRGGYTNNLPDVHGSVKEDRRYGGREDRRSYEDRRYSGREDRRSYEDDRRYGGREDRRSYEDDRRYGGREDRRSYEDDRRYGGREDRGSYSREDRGSYGREDRGSYAREDRGSYAREDRTSYGREENNAYRDEPISSRTNSRGDAATVSSAAELANLDSGETKAGILEVMTEGYGFVRCDNYLPGEQDVYVSPAMIRRFGLRTGDILVGNTRIKNQNEKFSALLYINTINGYTLGESAKRTKFEHLTPVFPDERIRLEVEGASNNISMRMMDLISPIGKGQRGLIVSQPKTGKTTLLKQVAKSVTHNYPAMKLIVLLIDERPEEVTDIKESIQGENVEVIYSTFDELPENHKRVSEMVIERAKRLVEHGEDVIILLDSITRLARAYNLTVQPSGRTLSGGLDPAALHMPKRFFGAARNMREGGSLTILATALVDTGSKMDDVVFEEFKGTGNMEMVLDRSLSEKRLFPAIDLPKSSTRRDDLLLDQEEIEANFLMRKAFAGSKSEEAVENIISMFRKTKSNDELVQLVKKVKIV